MKDKKFFSVLIGVVIVLVIGFGMFVSYNSGPQMIDYIDYSDEDLSEDELKEIECLNEGGNWMDSPLFTKSFCIYLTSDAGKECTDSSQCESACVTSDDAEIGSQATGMCYDNTFFSCGNSVENGTVTPVPCI